MPPLQHTCRPAVKSWFKVNNLMCAGLGLTNDEKLLFARDECVKLWSELDEIECGMILQGPPGVGKSTEVWAWACHQAIALKKSVLWVHVDEAMRPLCAMLTPKSCSWNCLDSDQLRRLMKTSDVDILIFDGYKSTDKCKKAVSFLFPSVGALPQNRKGIVISSAAAGLNPLHFGALSRKIRDINFSPWALTSYFEACENKDFFEYVSGTFEGIMDASQLTIAERVAYVKEKYYYAGASARWMFECSVREIIEMVERLLNKVDNFRSLLEGARGPQAKETSNHLLMMYRTSSQFQTFVVSQYVLKQLLSKSKDKTDIHSAYYLALVHENPAFLGWVVEFDFIQTLLNSVSPVGGNKLVLYENQQRRNLWQVTSITSFDPLTPFEEPWDFNQYRRPIKWNQGGYDAVGLVLVAGKRVLRFIRVTQGETHKLKLRFFSELAGMFQNATDSGTNAGRPIDGVEICIVLPRFEGRSLSDFPDIEVEDCGQLSHYNVGGSSAKWSCTNEAKQMRSLHFEASCPSFAKEAPKDNQRGPGLLRWLLRLGGR
jgi:hypothetical protein